MDYLGFDSEYLLNMADTIRFNVGNIFSMAIYLFVTVLGVYVVINLIQRIGK